MRSLVWFIFFLLLLAGVYWFYSNFFQSISGSSSIVQQTGGQRSPQAEPATTATDSTQPPAKPTVQAAPRSGDSMRNTRIGNRIDKIYSQHNNSLNQADK